MMTQLKVLLSMTVLLTACGAPHSLLPEDIIAASSTEGGSFTEPNGNESNDDENEGPGTSTPAPIIIEGPQVCYENGIDSCHALTHIGDLSTPSEYLYNNPGSNGPQYRKPDHFIDLTKPGTSNYVSENFMRTEFLSLFKGRYGLLSPLMIERVQNMRDELGAAIKVTSGYRGPTYNASIGGATWSRHMYGDALDFKVSGRSPSELKAFCEEQGASYIQVYVGHIHCDWRNEKLPEEFFPPQHSIHGKLQKTKSNQEIHEDFQKTVKIYYSGQTRSGKTITAFVVSENAEEANQELLREWTVLKEGHIIQKSTQTELSLNLKKGQYKIMVTLGGYWQQTLELSVNH